MSEITPISMLDLVKAFDSYLRDERMLSQATIERYVGVMEEFALFLQTEFGDQPFALEAMDKAHLIGFLRGQGQSRATWNTRLAALRSFYGYLFKEEIITVNPANMIDRVKTSPREPVPLTFDEMLKLVNALKASSSAYRTRNVAIVQILFHCALRVAELVSLNLDQVDVNGHLFLNVRRKGDKWLSSPCSGSA